MKLRNVIAAASAVVVAAASTITSFAAISIQGQHQQRRYVRMPSV